MIKRTAFLVVVVAAVAACGSKGDKPHDRAGTSADKKGDPTEPPPPPVVKPGGKGDCKTDYAPSPKRDPSPMCKIDGGTFTMGDDNERMAAKVSPYYIDQFEVTAAQVAYYLNATHGKFACDQFPPSTATCFLVPLKNVGPGNGHFVTKRANHFVVAPGYEHHPFVYATHSAAAEYCQWAGKSLATEARWEFAARHDPSTNKDLVFPWGDTFDPNRESCGDCTSSLNGNNEPLAVGSYDGTGGHGDGRSPWGVFDMAGNADEPVLGCENDYHPCDGPCVDPPGEPARKGQPCGITSRGGGSLQSHLTTSYRASNSETGIRCAR